MREFANFSEVRRKNTETDFSARQDERATLAGQLPVRPQGSVVALAVWAVLYLRVSAPINKRFTTAVMNGELPTAARELQNSWDSVINLRAGAQMAAPGCLTREDQPRGK